MDEKDEKKEEDQGKEIPGNDPDPGDQSETNSLLDKANEIREGMGTENDSHGKNKNKKYINLS